MTKPDAAPEQPNPAYHARGPVDGIPWGFINEQVESGTPGDSDRRAEIAPHDSDTKGLWLYWCDVDGYTTSRCSCSRGTSQGVRYHFSDWDAAVIAAKERRNPQSTSPDASGECVCHYNPDNGYRLSILCPVHDHTPVPPPEGRLLTDEEVTAFIYAIQAEFGGLAESDLTKETSKAMAQLLHKATTAQDAKTAAHMQAQVDAAEAEVVEAQELMLTIAKDSFDSGAEAAGQALMAQIDAAQERAKRLAEALEALLKNHVRLVSCGDCGNWDVETEQEVIASRAARAALAANE